MSDPLDWNAKTIAEFRANQGRVGGVVEGAPIVLAHHRGRNSGREHITPVMYLPHDTEPDIISANAGPCTPGRWSRHSASTRPWSTRACRSRQ